ncbi:hypothetical protein MCOR34_011339, partial [Pyricularia oryzae]
EQLVFVNKKNIGFTLRVLAKTDEIIVAHNIPNGLRVDEKVFEKAQKKFFAEETFDGDVDATFANVTLFNQLHNQFRPCLAAKLVNTGVENT